MRFTLPASARMPCRIEPIAGMPAGDEPPDGGDARGRRIHEERLAGRARRLLQVPDHDAGLRHRASGLDRHDPVHSRHVEHDAAVERNCLAVVPGAAATHRHRQPAPCGKRGDAPDLVLVPRQEHQVGETIVELRGEDRAVPEVVARARAAFGGLGDRLDAVELAVDRGPIARAHRLTTPARGRAQRAESDRPRRAAPPTAPPRNRSPCGLSRRSRARRSRTRRRG